jgi:hypothetical protein
MNLPFAVMGENVLHVLAMAHWQWRGGGALVLMGRKCRTAQADCHQDGAFLQFSLANHMDGAQRRKAREKVWKGIRAEWLAPKARAKTRRDSGGFLPN